MTQAYKCVNCGKPVPQIANKKHRLYCHDACRKAYQRRVSGQAKADNIKNGRAKADNLERCRYCGVALPGLQAPRKHPGACYECAIKQPRKRSEGYNPHFTGQMTGHETTNYKPASQLGKGEYNPVSKPGRCRACGEELDGESSIHCVKCIDGGVLEKGFTPNRAGAM